MEEIEAADLFGALSNADRLRIIRALVVAGPAGLSAGEIADHMGASASRTSFHLSALAQSGIVLRERQARSLRYSVDFLRIGALITFLMRDCCGNSPDLRACCP